MTPAPVKTIVSIDALEALDIRVGTIRGMRDVAKSKKLVKLQVDCGNHRRQVLAGLKPERLNPSVIVGLQALFVVNLGARPSIRVGRVASAVGPAARRADKAMPQRIGEEAQRGRWPHAAATRRARGGCGRIQRRTSSPMRWGIASSALLVCDSQDPRARPTRILGRAPEPRTMAGERSEGMLFDIGYADGLTPVLAVPETPVPDGARAG